MKPYKLLLLFGILFNQYCTAPEKNKPSQYNEIFRQDIPLEKQIAQGHQPDCQTVAALKYMALKKPESLRRMPQKDGESYVAHFPRLDTRKVADLDPNFDYKITEVRVSEEDLTDFRRWYGYSGSVGQDVIEAGLVKRKLKDEGSKNRKVSSVRDYTDYIGRNETSFLVDAENALFILTGEAYEDIESGKIRDLYLISSLTKAETWKKWKFERKIKNLLRTGKIAIASAYPEYVENGRLVPYHDSGRIAAFGYDIETNHGYAVVYNEEQDNVTLHNPWNHFEPQTQGDDQDDGVFTLTIEEFLTRFTNFYTKTEGISRSNAKNLNSANSR